MPEQFGDKTHEATPHRREKAREEGHVARSHDLASAITLLCGILLLLYSGGRTATYFGGLSQATLGNPLLLQDDSGAAIRVGQQLTWDLAGVVLPFLAALLIAAVAVQVGQVGFLFVPEKLALDWTRIDPLKGWQRIVSLTNFVRLGFGLIKLVVIGAVAFWVLAGKWDSILSAWELDTWTLAQFLVEIVLWTALKIALALLALAVFDYGFQRWKYEQDLRMSTQEIREEFRSLQGDPQVLQRRKAVQRQLMLNRIGTAVPKADVVVTNPTELAIAIQYDFETMPTPIVVAKGAGHVAQKIRRLALENGVPIVERKELARILYKAVEIGKPIPAEQFAAMAEVLRYVYQLQGKPLPTLPPRAAA